MNDIGFVGLVLLLHLTAICCGDGCEINDEDDLDAIFGKINSIVVRRKQQCCSV
jgi:hypothetical protein